MGSKSDAAAFKKLLVRNVTLPLLLGLASSAIFVILIIYQISVSNMADHSNLVIARANRLEKLMIDAETGLRGYVITADLRFFDPYIKAVPILNERFVELRESVSDNPTQQKRVDDIITRYESWKKYAEDLQKTVAKDHKSAASVVRAGEGKVQMDSIRTLFDQILQSEESLRASRNKETETTTRAILFIVIVFSLSSGAVIALMGKRQLVSLSDSYEASLQKQMQQNEILKLEQWIKTGQAELSEKMVGEKKLGPLCDAILAFLAKRLNASVGAMFVYTADQEYVRTGGFGVDSKGQKDAFRIGEGLIGQAAKDGQILELSSPGKDQLRITSSLIEVLPQHLMVIPIHSDEEVNAVIELGFLDLPSSETRNFINMVADGIGTAIKSAKYRERLETLLKEVQNQSEELQAQQEELRVSNEELEEQTRLLKDAQTRMESQHAELEQTNSQLEEQSRSLEQQADALNEKNTELMAVQEDLESKAAELERASKYKSEFLANMSHELRTPLNSSLILAKLLADNKDGNLSEQQVEFSKQILNSGNDLLTLINDILDLSKVESGKLDIAPFDFDLASLIINVERVFTPVAKEKGLEFIVKKSKDAPEMIYSDIHRIEQILKNLLSNAFKFTEHGTVSFEIKKNNESEIQFNVIDTGIGILSSQLEAIFEAFKQADGTTSRKFGGTGLGLSISRNLAKLLGGSIEVKSEPGKGSSFSLILPLRYQGAQASAALSPRVPMIEKPAEKKPTREKKNESRPAYMPDDRNSLTAGERCILVIEDDQQFAKILMGLAHDMKFKCVVAGSAEDGIELASTLSPDAVLLDMHLPDHSGLFVLDQLKQNSKTRHIPIHVISGHDFSQQAYEMGAVEYMLKPVKQDELMTTFANLQSRLQQNVKKVLIIEDDEVQRKAIASLIADSSMKIISVGLGEEALKALAEETFDCVIMDLNLPDMTGFDLLEKISKDDKLNHAPVIVYTGRDLSADEEARLKRHSRSVIIKGAKSPERLLDEVTLFLHQVESKLTPERKKMLESLRHRDRMLEGKKILIVDDDMRNIFALTSALEQKGAKISMSRNGEEAVKTLRSGKIPDLVLMDVMMPVMDGFEATRQIREIPELQKLPIIALTAKAMKDDRDKCLAAGANDYLTKPVDLEKLLSLIRVWMR